MRRSLCVVEPSVVIAAQMGNYIFTYTTSVTLPKGTKLKFDILSKGRMIDWQVPSAEPKLKENAIWLELEDSSVIYAKEVAGEESSHAFEFVLSEEVKAGDCFKIKIGSPSGKQGSTRAQTFLQRRRPFFLYIDPKGKGDYKEPEIFVLDIRGGALENIRILSPSLVGRNQRFDVVVRFEDAHGNLTANAPEGTLIELSYEHLRENLNWKLFIPETGFISIPNLYFNEPGIYRIQLKNLSTNQTFYSAPIKCLQETSKKLLWGQFHGESEKFDAVENIESCLRHVRDEKALHFYSVSPFDSNEEISQDAWKQISHHIAEFNEDQRFTTFLGFQIDMSDEDMGIQQLVYSKDGKPLLRKKDLKGGGVKKLVKSLTPKDGFSFPSFSMGGKHGFDFANLEKEMQPVVEIFNAWGSSECSEKDGNPYPIAGKGKNAINAKSAGSILDALSEGHRFGFIAGGYDDRGIYSNLYDADQTQYTAGLTAVIAEDHTREAIVEALFKRNCYATTGSRIVVGFHIAGSIMGEVLNTKAKPGLAINRHISAYVASPDTIKSVEIICNGTVLKTFHPKETRIEFTYDDMRSIQELAIETKNQEFPFVYYFLRVTEASGHMAWSSPIWIEVQSQTPGAVKKVASKKAKK
jgi:Protein of unknown function (DUF3604)